MSLQIPMKPQLAVSASVFRDGRILLVRRARAPGLGLWSLPGGRVEVGESLEIALRREVMEETGLQIDIAGLAGWREVLPGASGSTAHFVIMSFATRWRAGATVLNDELDAFSWLPPDSPGAPPLTPGLLEIIAAARALIHA